MQNRVIACLVIALFAVSIFNPLYAQSTQQLVEKSKEFEKQTDKIISELQKMNPYTIEKGDTLWDLAGVKLNDARKWTRLVELNPFLQERGRQFTKDGKIIVLLHPGEKLNGLDELGIIPKSEPVPAADPVVIHDQATWPWYLLLVLIAAAIIIYLFNRMLNAPAASSGTPYVPGGVNAITATDRFRQMASNQNYNRTGQSMPLNSFTILEQTAGRIWGILNVRYANHEEVLRRLDGAKAFRAKVRFPDQHEETLYMLQACGNDLRYGGISRYLPGPEFRFEADGETVRPEPAPVAPAPTAPQPAPAPVQEPTEKSSVPAEDGTMKFEIKKAGDGQPAMVRMTGVDEKSDTAVEIRDGQITVRFTPRQTKAKAAGQN